MPRTALPSILLPLLLAACGGADPAPAPAPVPPPPAEAPPVCTYVADVGAVSVGWKAFKFTEKTGVGGGFGALSLTGAKDAQSRHGALDGLAFEIPVASIDSKNPDRDKKIVDHLFGTMADTAALKGSLKVTGPEAGELSITMNGATHAVPVMLKTEGGTISLSGALDLATWGGGPAVDALNKVCDDLHKGADGVSKLWTEVEISATVPVKDTCVPAR